MSSEEQVNILLVDDQPGKLMSYEVILSELGENLIKAQSATEALALATEVPILLTSYLPGQETPNVTFVTESGLGLYTPKPEQLLEAVQELAQSESTRWRSMSERAAEISRPYASLDIAHQCLLVAERYRAAGQANR